MHIVEQMSSNSFYSRHQIPFTKQITWCW